MADIKTVFRELSVIYGVEKLFSKSPIPRDYEDFCGVVEKYANNSSSYSLVVGQMELIVRNKQTITNGLEIAKGIVSAFKITTLPKMIWVGESTQSGTPIDIKVNGIGISLKEDSFILENMGLYKMVNLLTGSDYSRGSLHIFKKYAPEEYKQWFEVTWMILVNQLKNKGDVVIHSKRGDYISRISLVNEQSVKLEYESDDRNSYIELSAHLNLDEFEKKTNGLIREKVFAKWVNSSVSSNDKYLAIKKACAVAAGKNLTKDVNRNGIEANLSRLFRIADSSYYYAKASRGKVRIFEIPSLDDFSDNFEITNLNYAVPKSQLNFYTEVTNKKTRKSLTFRNEIRFSHGQFNGTPEAKLYIERGSLLETIYKQIYENNYQYVGH